MYMNIFSIIIVAFFSLFLINKPSVRNNEFTVYSDIKGTEDSVTAESILHSTEYKKLCGILLNGWEISVKGNCVTIRSKEKMWFFNCINMPAFLDSTELDKYVKNGGFYLNYNIVFRFVPRWKPWELKRYSYINDSIQSKISNLPVKYKINNFTHKYGSYIGSTEEEERRVQAYEKEKLRLETIIEKYIIPDFNSGQYSIFISHDNGFNPCVYPDTGEPALLFDRIKDLFK